MIIIIIFLVIGLVFSIEAMWGDIDGFVDLVMNIIGTAFVLVVAALIGFIIALALPMKTETHMDTYEIVTIKDNNGIGGRFFLGTGVINNKMSYAFYYKSDNGFVLKQTDIDNTTVKYSDNPRVEQYRRVKVDSFINYFAFDFIESECSMKYIIYVPEGTIVNQFNLDVE